MCAEVRTSLKTKIRDGVNAADGKTKECPYHSVSRLLASIFYSISLAPNNHAGCRFSAANALIIYMLLLQRDAS